MRRQIIVAALAAVAGWTFVPTEASAFGHHHRRRAASNACCTPQPVQSCQPSVQYHSEPMTYAQPVPTSSCCGGDSMGGIYGQPMGGTMPPQPLPQGSYPNGGMNYQGQGAYNQGYGQGQGNFNNGQQGVGANVSGNVNGAGNGTGANVGGGVNAGANGTGANLGGGANVGGGAGNVGGGANVGGNVGGAGANVGAAGAATSGR